jgi:hypothetical protein
LPVESGSPVVFVENTSDRRAGSPAAVAFLTTTFSDNPFTRAMT